MDGCDLRTRWRGARVMVERYPKGSVKDKACSAKTGGGDRVLEAYYSDDAESYVDVGMVMGASNCY